MEQTPSWEANQFSANQEIPKGSLPCLQVPATCLYPEPDQSSPLPCHSTFLRFILIWSSHLRLGLPSDLFPSGFPTKTPYVPLLSPVYATCPAHFILPYLITWIIFGMEYRLLSSSLCSFLHSPVTSSLLGPNILLSTLFLNTFSLHSSLSVSDQVSHPYKTTGKIIFPYISIFIFLDSTLQDKSCCTEW